MKINYKGIKYEVYTGPKGGQYILINNKKYYVKSIQKKNESKEESSRMDSTISTSGIKEAGRDTLDDKISSKMSLMMSCYVPDPEHEGDIDWQLNQLRRIGNIEVVDVEREYTDDGEELTYACINFKCSPKDYNAFKEYCEHQ